MKKWREHSTVLTSCNDFIDNEIFSWCDVHSDTLSNDIPTIQRELSQAQNFSGKLRNYKDQLKGLVRAAYTAAPANAIFTEASLEEIGESQHVQAALAKLDNEMERRKNVLIKWENADQLKSNLLEWLSNKRTDLKDITSKKAKLHKHAAQLDLSRLQEIKNDLIDRRGAIDDLTVQYDQIENCSSESDSVREIFNDLLSDVELALTARTKLMNDTSSYEDLRSAVASALDSITEDSVKISKHPHPLKTRVENLEVSKLELACLDIRK